MAPQSCIKSYPFVIQILHVACVKIQMHSLSVTVENQMMDCVKHSHSDIQIQWLCKNFKCTDCRKLFDGHLHSDIQLFSGCVKI